MGIQSTREIMREDAIDLAIRKYAETHREMFSRYMDSKLEDYIEEPFYNFRIIRE